VAAVILTVAAALHEVVSVSVLRSDLRQQAGREALDTMMDTNNFAEGEIITRLCAYLDAHKDYFERVSFPSRFRCSVQFFFFCFFFVFFLPALYVVRDLTGLAGTKGVDANRK
jgi:hypothetical protein